LNGDFFGLSSFFGLLAVAGLGWAVLDVFFLTGLGAGSDFVPAVTGAGAI
jgi:hypothetical protein